MASWGQQAPLKGRVSSPLPQIWNMAFLLENWDGENHPEDQGSR